jgi:RNA-directed DNA polymerase
VTPKLGLTINEAKTSLKNARAEDFDFLRYTLVTVAFFPYYGASPATPGTRLRVGRLRNRENMQVSPSQ